MRALAFALLGLVAVVGLAGCCAPPCAPTPCAPAACDPCEPACPVYSEPIYSGGCAGDPGIGRGGTGAFGR